MSFLQKSPKIAEKPRNGKKYLTDVAILSLLSSKMPLLLLKRQLNGQLLRHVVIRNCKPIRHEGAI